MEYFWRYGYEAASLDNLLRYIGISRSSLYAAYAGKSALFVAAFERYIRTVGMEALTPLLKDGTPEARVRRTFATIVDQVSSDPAHRGCLMVNTIAELSERRPELARIAHAARDGMWEMFRDAIAPPVSAAPPPYDVDGAADLLLALFVGLRVLARGGLSRERATVIVDRGLDAIFGPAA